MSQPQFSPLQINFRQDTGVLGDFISRDGAIRVTQVGAGNRVEYSSNGINWQATQPTPIEGSNTVFVRQVDPAGNASAAQRFDFILDTMVNAVGVTLANDTGVAGDLLTNDGTLNITGVEAGARLVYIQDGITSDVMPVGREGVNIIYVRQVDLAGNASTLTRIRYVKDSQISPLTITLDQDTGASNSDLISSIGTFSVTGIDADAQVSYSTDGSNWSPAVPTAVEGLNTIYVRQIDLAGNVAQSQLTFTLDTLAPDTPLVALLNDTGSSDTDLITNIGTLSVTGIEAGAIVEYSSNGTDWSTSQPTATEGSNTVWVRQTDAAGNVSAANQLTFTLDSQVNAPTVALLNDTGSSNTDQITNSAALSLSGIEDGALVEYSSNGTDWSISQPMVTEGSNTIWVRQTDVAGNVSTATQFSFTLDTTNPDAPTLALQADTGRFDDDNLTNDSTILVSNAEIGATIEYSSNGTDWSNTAPTPVQGSNTVWVRQVDVAGNASAATSISFMFDSIAPNQPRLELDDDTGLSSTDNISSNGTLLIRGLASDVELEYSIDGINWDPSTPIPEEGLNSIWVRQIDRAGNASAPQTIVFTLDTTAPVAPVITLSQDTGNSATDLLTNMAALSLAGIEAGALVEYSTDDGETWSDVAPTAVEGSNTVWVRQTDLAGNVSDTSSISFVLDTQIADLTITLDQDTGSSSTDMISSVGTFTVTGVEDGALVEYSTDEGETWTAIAPTATEGSNSIWVRQTDVAGNVSNTQQLSFTLDTQIATLGIALQQDTGSSSTDLITNIGAISLSNVEDGALVEYSTDNGMTWSDVAPSILEGLNTIVVRQTDVAGNVSAESTISFILDTQISTPTLSLNSDTGASNSDLITKVGGYSVANIDPDTLVEYSTDGNTWSTTAPTAMEGSNTIHVRQTDVAGNVASSSLTFTLDTQVVAPMVALAQDTGRFNNDRITNVSTLSVTGTEIGALIEYSTDGTHWSATQPTATQGSNTVYVRQTDVAGNVSSSTPITFTFDTVAPAQPRIELDQDTGVSSTDLITSNGALLVRGLAADVQLQYSVDGSNWTTNTVTPVEGVNTIFIRQVDRAGNASPAQSITFTLDTSAAAPIVSLTNDSGLSDTDRITNDSRLTIEAEDGALIEYSTDGNTWTTGVPIASAGLNTVFVRQTDKAGNVSAATQFSFTLDLSAPVEPTIALTNDTGLDDADFVTNDGRLTVTTEMGALVEYSTDGTTWSTTQPAAVEGLNTIQVRQTDTAGNVSAAQQITFTLDTQNPAALDVGLNNDTGNSNTDTITSDPSFFINGTENGALVEYSTDDGMTWGATAPTPVEGSNTILLRQTDVAGNVSATTTLSFVLDTQVNTPIVTLKQDTGLSSTDLITQIGVLIVSGTEVGALIEYSTDSGANWSPTAPTAAEGNNSVWVRQTDVAGNVSRAQQISFVLDTQLPDAPMVELTTDTGLVGDDRISSIGALSVTGTEDGALIEYSVDNGETWSDTQPTPTEGENTVLVRQTDVAGNVSATSSITFTFDTMVDAPTVALTNDTGANDDDLITNNGALTVTGTEDGALIEYSLDGMTWSDMQPKYAQGSNTVYVRQTDLAGNVSDAQTLTFTFDTLVDTPTLSLEEDTGDFDDDLITRNPQINVANLEAGGTWAYQIDGMGEWFEGSGTSFDAIDGEHSYVVRQTDVAGNVQDSASFTVNAILEPAPVFARMFDSNDNEVENGATSDPNAVLRLRGDSTDTWQYRFVAPNNLDAEWQDVTGDTDLSLIEGSYNVETRKIDIAGNFVSALNRVNIDTFAATPIMTLVEDTGVDGDGITTNPFVTVSGVEGNAIWEVRIDDSTIWNQTTLSTFEYKLLLGTHTYHIRQIDKAGNISAEGSYTFTYQSEIEQPTVTLADDTGLSDGDMITSNSTINVGLLPEATAWQYSIDDGEWIDGVGSSFEMLTDGMGHNYAVRQQSAGLWSEPTPIYGVQFDNTAPADFMVALAADTGASDSDNITNNSALNVSGLEVGTRLQFRIDGGEWRGVDVTTSELVFDLLVGTHAYDFRLVDLAGNTSGTISQTYTYINADLAAPSLMLAEDTERADDGITANRQVDVTLSVTGAGITWQYEVDGSGTWINGTGTSFDALDGVHSYRVRQVDVAGNISPASDALAVNVDAAAPVFSSGLTGRVTDLDSQGQQLIATSQVLYTATATDDTAITYSMADSDVFSFDSATGQLSFKQPVGYVLGGNNSYSTVITATDAAGNSTDQTVTIHVDRNNTAAPVIELAEVFSGNFVAAITPTSTKLQSDGKILALLDAGNLQPKQIVRYLEDGSLDSSFTPIQFAGSGSSNTVINVTGFSTDSSGQVYVTTLARNFSNNTQQVTASRFTSTGQPDSSWGGTGQLTFSFAASNSPATEGSILNDGSYFVASGLGSESSIFIRFSASGQVSNTPLSLAGNSQQAFYRVSEVDPTGQFVYVAFGAAGSYQGIGVSKYRLSNNTLDTSFGTNGTLKLVNSNQAPSLVDIDSQGRLIVAYHDFSGASKVYRVLANGTVDTSFGVSGVASVSTSERSSSFELASDGSVYVLSGNKLTHLLANGTLDPNFGTNGQVIIGGFENFAGSFVPYAYSIKQIGNVIQIMVPSKTSTDDPAYVIAQFDATGKLVNSFGDVLLTITEGNRPIGLLSGQASIIDTDAVSISYDGVTVSIARQTGADSTDVFGTRGNLSFADGKIVWSGTEVGTVSNTAGQLVLTFNDAATHEVFDGVTRAITFTNTSQQPPARLQLLWTVNDNDPSGARSSTAVQTINVRNDNRDAGDPLVFANNNGVNLTLKNMILVDGKYYYLQDVGNFQASVNRNSLDQFFNNGQDTTVNARSYTQADGMQYKLLTAAEINTLLGHPSVVANSSWVSQLFAVSGTDFMEQRQGVWAADLGNNANTHLFKRTAQDNFTVTQDDFFSSGPRYALIEVSPATQEAAVLQPQLRLAEDNGDSATDFLTSNGVVNVLGIERSLPFRYSIDGGTTWLTVPANANSAFELPEGTYFKDQIVVEQTDLGGFVTTITNGDTYRIDKTIKAVSMLNDQGMSSTDFITADGRVVATGIVDGTPYEYSTNGGNTWQAGGMLDATTYGFTLGTGSYGINSVVIRQTIDGFTTFGRNNTAYVVDPVRGQGTLTLNVDTGTSFTDRLTNDGKFSATGFDATTPWEYSIDGGNNWLNGVGNGTTKSFEVGEGSYAAGAIRIRQTDSKGFLLQFQTSDSYVVDTTIATASISLLNDTGFSNTDLLTADGRIRIDINGTLAAGDVWEYTINGGQTWTKGSGSSLEVTLPNGIYNAQQIRARVTDDAGNISIGAFDQRVVIDDTDNSAPVFTSANTAFATDRDGTNATLKVISTTALMTVQTTDANTVYYSLSGANAHLFNINSNGQITFKTDTNLTSNSGDRYDLTVNAVDAFNNASSQDVTLTILPPFELVSRSVAQSSDTINADRYVLTFSHNIALDPTGQIKVSNFAGDFFIDASDTSRVQVSGNQLIIFNKGFDNHLTTYRFDLKGLVTSTLNQEVWQPPRAEIGFYVNKSVRFENNQLSTNDGVVVQSIDGGNKLGMVTILGDVNGDGIDDWAVSYANADSRGLTDNGKIYVVYGRTDGVTTNLSQVANGQGGYLITGTDNGGLAGSSISAGDVNGDGLRDIAIHVPGANGGMGLGYVVFGRPNASNIDLTFGRGGFAGGRFYSINTSDSFAFVGDVNGDGFDDVGHGRGNINRTTVVENITVRKVTAVRDGKIIVKADWLSFAADWIDAAMKINDFIDDPLSGSVELMAELPDRIELVMGSDGNISPVERAMADQLRQVINELRPNQRLIDYSFTQTGGSSGGLLSIPKDTVYNIKYTIETTVKDINRITTTLFGSGETNVQLGGPDGNSGGINVIATEGQQRLGAQVTSLGDINGDGRADFGILDGGQGGQPAQMSVVFGARDNVNIFTGNLQQGIGGFRIRDPQRTAEYEGLGNITGLGDINGDGINDFAVTTDSVHAATYIVYGRAGMTGVDLNQVTAGNGGYRLSPSSRSSNVHVHAIGDFNGDGLDDYVATSNSGFGDVTGTMYVIYGSRTNPDLTGSLFGITDETLGFGEKGFRITSPFSFADSNAVSAGDINSDGLTDLAIRGSDGQTIFVMGSTTNGKFSQINPDQVGTSGNDTLTSTGAQLIVAGHGNDTIHTNGADVILAGSGNDTVVLDSGMITALYNRIGSGGNVDQLARIDGGAGRDTLQLSGGVSLDFTRISNKMMDTSNIKGRVHDIEVIDMATDAAGNTLRLGLNDVLESANSNVFNLNTGWSNVSGGQLSSVVAKHQLVVTGNSNDVVQLRSSEWSNTGATVREQATNEIYNVYQANNGVAAQLLIDRDAQVTWF